MPPLIPNRRALLKLIAGGAAASVAACSRPDEVIYPAVNQPDGSVPGQVRRYVSALPLGGYLRGVTGLVVDGRPIKLEGLAAHPASLGATDLFTEVSILDLYDPQRLRAPAGPPGPSSWPAAARAIWERIAPRRGQGTVLLTGRVTSPTLLARIAALQAQFPGVRHVRWEPLNDDNVLAGTQAALGRRLTPRPRLADADVILCLGADPLGPGPEQVALARAWATRRRRGPPPRLYAIEPSLTATGAMGDRRVAANPRELALACHALVALLNGPSSVSPQVPVGAEPVAARAPSDGLSPPLAEVIQAAARDLLAAHGRALVLVGERQPPELHAFAAWANAQLAAPVDYTAPIDPDGTPHRAGLAAVARGMHAGRVDTLVTVDCNPCYAAPPELAFADALKRVPLSVHAGCFPDEMSARTTWSLPLSHPLESWRDGRAPDGTASIAQPLVRPFYDTRDAAEIVDLLADPAEGPGSWHRLREQWASLGEQGWQRALVAGVVRDTASAPEPVGAARLVLPPVPAPGLAIELRPSPTLHDGRFASNAWAQECPDPLTKEVWGSSVRLHPDDMAALGVADGDMLRLERGGTLTLPVRAQPGQARGVATLLTGYGRSDAGAVAEGIGANAWVLDTDGPVRIVKALGRLAVTTTQHQFALEGELAKLFPVLRPGEAMPRVPARASLLPNPPTPSAPPQWAMAIDTDVCIGCNACVVACQAENNVPAIGPAEMAVGRDMHWLRIDTYEHDDVVGFQPVPCMQCEKAPCEPVCPVEASVHDTQGLNLQVYNRCIGTRTCQANCPYKVRRFNFLDYADRSLWGDAEDASVIAQKNPDVSVRARGVMEKCTYCVQRVTAANRAADAGGTPGPVVTACQAACPTAAITLRPAGRAGDRRGARRPPALRAAGGARHQAAHNLSRAAGERRVRRWTLPSVTTLDHVTEAVAAPLLDRRAGAAWWTAFLAALALAGVGALAIGFSLACGPGLWGNNTAVVWGFPDRPITCGGSASAMRAR